MRSPTAGNMMLYSIIEISDPKIKKELVKSCDNQPFISKAQYLLLFVADYQRWMDYFEYSNIDSLIEKGICTIRKPQEGDLMLACCDALIAAQTAVIAAESLGVGSCYIGDIMENHEFHRELFNLPQYTFPITLLCFGYANEKSMKIERSTRLAKEFVHFKDHYKRLTEEELSVMYKDRELNHYIRNANNFGQHMYIKKFTADFSIEMTRSVKKAIQSWCGDH